MRNTSEITPPCRAPSNGMRELNQPRRLSPEHETAEAQVVRRFGVTTARLLHVDRLPVLVGSRMLMALSRIIVSMLVALVALDARARDVRFGFHGAFSDTDLDRDVQMIQVNLVALTSLTKLFVRGMVARGYGKVLNVGSTASFASTPLMNVYAATKAYVLSFSEALAEELQGSGVTVTVLCPGSTNTRFAERAQMTDTRIFRGRVMNAREVARVGYTALLRGQRVAVVGAANKGMVFSMRFTPRSVVTKIAKRMMAKGPLTARHPTKHEAASR
jgi:uncharacterized protein